MIKTGGKSDSSAYCEVIHLFSEMIQNEYLACKQTQCWVLNNGPLAFPWQLASNQCYQQV